VADNDEMVRSPTQEHRHTIARAREVLAAHIDHLIFDWHAALAGEHEAREAQKGLTAEVLSLREENRQLHAKVAQLEDLLFGTSAPDTLGPAWATYDPFDGFDPTALPADTWSRLVQIVQLDALAGEIGEDHDKCTLYRLVPVAWLSLHRQGSRLEVSDTWHPHADLLGVKTVDTARRTEPDTLPADAERLQEEVHRARGVTERVTESCRLLFADREALTCVITEACALLGTTDEDAGDWPHLPRDVARVLSERNQLQAGRWTLDPSRAEAYTADAILRRVVEFAGHGGRAAPAWVHVKQATSLGAGFSQRLCRHYGVDPDEMRGEDIRGDEEE
jgi:hypothetical protein